MKCDALTSIMEIDKECREAHSAFSAFSREEPPPWQTQQACARLIKAINSLHQNRNFEDGLKKFFCAEDCF